MSQSRRPGGKIYQWPVQQMQTWYQKGLTCDEIAARLGEVHSHTHPSIKATGHNVGRVLRRHGCQMRKTGAPMARNGFWRGGQIIDKHGYILVKAPDHPYRNRAGYVRKHRLVMEKKLGRYLLPGEVVHHKDDNHQNNRPSNLVLYDSNGSHLRETLMGKCPKWTSAGKQKIRQTTRQYWQKFREVRSRQPGLTATEIHTLLKQRTSVTS